LQQRPHPLLQQPPLNQVQPFNPIAAEVKKSIPIEEKVKPITQNLQSSPPVNISKESVDSIILPTSSIAAHPISGETDRREPPKFGGKGTFSSISAVAAAAGHINPLLNSSPSSIDGGLSKTCGGPSHPGIIGNGSINANQNPAQSVGPSEEIRLPVGGIGMNQSGASHSSSHIENGNSSAANALKGVVSQHTIAQKGVASQKGEVKPLRINLSKTQRDKFKDKKLKEEPENQREKEQEKEKGDDRGGYQDKEREYRDKERDRDTLRQQPLATVSTVSEVLTYENLELGDVATLSKMRDATAAKLLELERKTMLVIILAVFFRHHY
jgi:hypothetical protein